MKNFSLPRIPNWIILILMLLVFSWLLLTRVPPVDKNNVAISDLHLCVEQDGVWKNISVYASTDQDKYLCGVVTINHQATIELTVSIYNHSVLSIRPIDWSYLSVADGPFRANIPDNLTPGEYKVVIGTARSDFATLIFAVDG